MHPEPQNGPTVYSPPDDVAGGWTPRLVCSLVSMVLILELLTISYIMISTALPQIVGTYHTTQGAWLLTAFLLVGAVLSPVFGKLADMYGKRRLLLVAVSIAALGSLISAIAPSYGIVVLGRALQGLLVPCMFLSYSLIRDVFPQKTVPLAVSIVTSGMGLITIPSPWLTGWLLESWGFRAVFWFFMITLTVLTGLVAITTSESPVRIRSKVDFLGAMLLGVGLAGVLVGISFAPSWGWGSVETIGCIVVGVAVLVVWVVAAMRMRDPLIDVRFFRRRSISLTALTAGLAYSNTAVYNTLMPMLCMAPVALGLGYGFGVDAEGYAVFQAPIGAASVVGGLIVGFLVERHTPRSFMALGQVFLIAATALTALARDTRLEVILWCVLAGIGLGLTYAATPNLVIRAVPAQLQGSMSSMVQVFQGGLSAIFPVIVFTVMNAGGMRIVGGSAFYEQAGMQVGFLIAAGTSLVGLLVALCLPRAARRSEPLVPERAELVAD